MFWLEANNSQLITQFSIVDFAFSLAIVKIVMEWRTGLLDENKVKNYCDKGKLTRTETNENWATMSPQISWKWLP